jgi:hypothetical protein
VASDGSLIRDVAVSARRLAAKAALGAEAALALTVASLALRVVPRRRVVRLLGHPSPSASGAVGAVDARARHVGRAVERVAAILPWRPRCLPQAIATRTMLRWRGVPCEGHLGVRSLTPFEAHAWVTVQGRVVQGGPLGDATELAAFR